MLANVLFCLGRLKNGMHSLCSANWPFGREPPSQVASEHIDILGSDEELFQKTRCLYT